MSVLDSDELFHLGLNAAKINDPQKAIEYLKQCLDIAPGHPQATYLLGAMYAQIGMYDRAKSFLAQAITLNPQEYTAIFQLGLLHLTSGEIEPARSIWSELDVLGPDQFLYLFKSGMLALVEDDFASCVDLIERGISANTINEALNVDMRKVKASAEAALSGTAGDAENIPGANHLVLSGYQQAQHK